MRQKPGFVPVPRGLGLPAARMEGDGRRACAGYSRSGAMIFEGKRIVVTGGTGSMGKTFVRRVLTGERGTPRKVIVFSRDEAKQHSMRVSYFHRHVTPDELS